MGMTGARIWRGVIGLIATGDLLGMLAVDAIFDVEKDVSTFKAYYCTLLNSMSRFPEVLRVALPCLLLATCVGANCVLQGRSHGDIIAAFVPATIGLFIFNKSVNSVHTLCTSGDGMLWWSQVNLEHTRSEMIMLHVYIGVVLVASLVGQLMALRAALATYAGKQKSR